MIESPDNEFRKGILSRPNPNNNPELVPSPFPSASQVVDSFFKRNLEEVEPEKQFSDYEKAARRKNSENGLTKSDFVDIAQNALDEMKQLDTIAEDTDRWLNITPEQARAIKRIVVFSAPGTYIQPVKNDRYKDKIWAWAMDRTRSDQAVRLGIVLAGFATGEPDLLAFAKPGLLDTNDTTVKVLMSKAREALKKSGIRYAYVARPDEKKAVELALKDPTALVPQGIVDFISGPHIDNTIDQVREVGSFLRNNGLQSGDGVVFVAHGPQLVRMAGKFEKYQTVPTDLTTYFDPVLIPRLGMNEYPLMETKGRLAYVVTGDSSVNSCSYQILGK